MTFTSLSTIDKTFLFPAKFIASVSNILFFIILTPKKSVLIFRWKESLYIYILSFLGHEKWGDANPVVLYFIPEIHYEVLKVNASNLISILNSFSNKRNKSYLLIVCLLFLQQTIQLKNDRKEIEERFRSVSTLLNSFNTNPKRFALSLGLRSSLSLFLHLFLFCFPHIHLSLSLSQNEWIYANNEMNCYWIRSNSKRSDCSFIWTRKRGWYDFGNL
jgi:hypothetical protein